MKRKIFCLCVCAAGAVGCWGPVNLSNTEVDSDLVLMDKLVDIVSDVRPKSLFITGVEYPYGVEWQGDVSCDIAGSVLFLMKDRERIVEVPVGSDNCVSVDADMHRCIGGHLYTDFSTDAETVVKMDGQELFRYSGRETVASMYVKDSDVYTLGIPRSGEGWAFRKNGDAMLSGASGELVGGLYEDKGVIVFSYMDRSADGSGASYYVVRNSLAARIGVNAGVTSVDDVRLVDGTVNYVAAMDGSPGEFLFDGDGYGCLERSADCTMQGDLRMHYDGKSLFVTGSMGGGTGLWKGSALEAEVVGRMVGLKLCEDTYIYISQRSSGDFDGISMDGTMSEWPDGYDLLYEGCVATDGTDFTVGMVDRTAGNSPALWKNGEITALGFNGVITGVYYQ